MWITLRLIPPQECFTYVLKGHIAVSAAVFPNGTKEHPLAVEGKYTEKPHRAISRMDQQADDISNSFMNYVVGVAA
ncbi:hypothetical protein CCH79_00014249 [Gambusia affinis]|uniref:Uncharacterized protein n=1 Tax=Gambusia affinis TaxID=33528 RepID=A0A315UTA4_GAMAF|nr:hypothetical protein CCH79_00014249 [Gambusia affinis]